MSPRADRQKAERPGQQAEREEAEEEEGRRGGERDRQRKGPCSPLFLRLAGECGQESRIEEEEKEEEEEEEEEFRRRDAGTMMHQGRDPRPLCKNKTSGVRFPHQ